MFFIADLQIAPISGRFGQLLHPKKRSHAQVFNLGFMYATEI
jgi:hypothetical protein